MEEQAHENAVQNIPKSCSSIPSSISPKKEGSVESRHVEDTFSSPTPAKTKEPSRIKSKEELRELPEMYGTLLEFFERLICSLRLLRLRKRNPIFQNISNQVEVMTGRKLLCTHLAQIKYILPEAVQIDKVLIHDEKTKCMKPDMKISMFFDVVKDYNEESVYVALIKLFSSRLREFYMENPEGSDVPEADLPEPFSQKTMTFKTYSTSDMSTSHETEILNSSHLPPSFSSHLHQKAAAAFEMEKIFVSSPVKSAYEATEESDEDAERLKSLPGSSSTVNTCENTPAKSILGSDSVVVVGTPVLSTPVRPISLTRSELTSEDENKMSGSQSGKQSTISAKKSLDFYGMDDQDTSLAHKQSSVSLSDFVFSIHRVFQSVNFCPITKEELVQKVIMNNFEFDDRSVVEMQMEDLEKLVPDWFCKKLARSGDLLYSVKKVSDLNSVRERVNVM